MDLELRGRRALVTGSTAGIGFATAQALAAEGAAVIVNGRTEARVATAVRAIREAVPGAHVGGVAADLSTAESCDMLTSEVPGADVLINNVGIFDPKPFEEIPDTEWLAFSRPMCSAESGSAGFTCMVCGSGTGVASCSSPANRRFRSLEMIHYAMTKTAQLSVARGLAETTVGTGVTVNSVLPGPTASEGVADFVQRLAQSRGIDFETKEREFFASARPSSLLRRFARPEEVAAMIVYVCSARASATNGAALRVDGGVVRGVL